MKTRDMVDHLKQGELENANLAVDDLIDYWKIRVISYAEAEAEESVFHKFHALKVLNDIHSRDEERLLLSEQ